MVAEDHSHNMQIYPYNNYIVPKSRQKLASSSTQSSSFPPVALPNVDSLHLITIWYV